MSTVQQQAPPAEAVEEQMGKIVTELPVLAPRQPVRILPAGVRRSPIYRHHAALTA
jgi:hypothetical protein